MNNNPDISRELIRRGGSRPVSPSMSTGQEIVRASGNRPVSPSSYSAGTRSLTQAEQSAYNSAQ